MSSVKVENTFYIEHKDREFEVVVSAQLVHDSHYGADADGNRGVPMDFIEDVTVESVAATDDEPISDDDKKEVEKLAEAKADKHEWEAPEPDYPDYDDRDE
jgi:hypothetical protein